MGDLELLPMAVKSVSGVQSASVAEVSSNAGQIHYYEIITAILDQQKLLGWQGILTLFIV
jgi:hypothetical protein